MATRHQMVAVGQLRSSVRGRTERATGSACTATDESDHGCSPQAQRIRVRHGVSQTHRLADVSGVPFENVGVVDHGDGLRRSFDQAADRYPDARP